MDKPVRGSYKDSKAIQAKKLKKAEDQAYSTNMVIPDHIDPNALAYVEGTDRAKHRLKVYQLWIKTCLGRNCGHGKPPRI